MNINNYFSAPLSRNKEEDFMHDTMREISNKPWIKIKYPHTPIQVEWLTAWTQKEVICIVCAHNHKVETTLHVWDDWSILIECPNFIDGNVCRPSPSQRSDCQPAVLWQVNVRRKQGIDPRTLNDFWVIPAAQIKKS